MITLILIKAETYNNRSLCFYRSNTPKNDDNSRTVHIIGTSVSKGVEQRQQQQTALPPAQALPPLPQQPKPQTKFSVQNRLNAHAEPMSAVKSAAPATATATAKPAPTISSVQERMAMCRLDSDELQETEVNPKHGYLGVSEHCANDNEPSKVNPKEFVELVTQKYSKINNENRPLAKPTGPSSVQQRLIQHNVANDKGPSSDMQKQTSAAVHPPGIQVRTRLGPGLMLSVQNIKSFEKEQTKTSIGAKVRAWTGQENTRFIANDAREAPILQPKVRAIPDLLEVIFSIPMHKH